MKRQIELLAPGGDLDSIKAAIIARADAVYCGLDKFNARNRASNITQEDLNGILRLAHQYNCQVFLTLNIIIVESEIRALIKLLNTLVNTSIDGVIVQDLGMIYLLNEHFPTLNIHASTQLTTHNAGQIQFLNRLKVSRVNLSRELNIHEIEDLTHVSHKHDIQTEVFVHGSYCLSISGICYMSSVTKGTSGNRGRCSQPCRDQYLTTPAGKDFPLNMKDNSAWTDLEALAHAGVDSLKIEGRIKKFHYVFSIVESWKKQLQQWYSQEELSADKSILYQVFNRDFSDGFLKGDISKDMFIDNPRDHSAFYLAEQTNSTTAADLEQAKSDVYHIRTDIINTVSEKIKILSIEKGALTLRVSGKPGELLKVSVTTPESTFEVQSNIDLSPAKGQPLDQAMLLKRFKSFNDTEFTIKDLDVTRLDRGLSLPFKELTSLKNRILFILNASRTTVSPVTLPVLINPEKVLLKPTLSVLISSPEDTYLCKESSASIYFQLPDKLSHTSAEYIELFNKNKKLIPWFPSVLIGEDYAAALEFLSQVQPGLIVTNNTGVAFTASESSIPWIAGPFLNNMNSYSLLNLKDNFNCRGAFLSNELKRSQIKGIKRPDDFELYYSIYHPQVLMTSRQCLFHTVTGCEKDTIDSSCISQCEKSAEITNLKQESFFITKTKGNYHNIYNETNYLNTDIISDMPDLFSGYSIDLRDIKTGTLIEKDKSVVIALFKKLLKGNPDAANELHEVIYPTISTQYERGI